jgi:alkylhydroperoxidase family enzyme
VTWLPDTAGGATGFDSVFGLRPDLYGPFREFYAVFWRDRLVDPVVLELCRLRVGQLLGCESELAVRYAPEGVEPVPVELVRALPQWPTSDRFDASQRAALAFAEQFVIDPKGIRGPVRDELRAQFALPEVVALTEALALFDGFTRFRLILGVDGADVAGVEGGVTVDPSQTDAPLP